MDLDNDLLTKWLDAMFAGEAEVRDLIEEIQTLRNEAAADAAQAEEETAEENAALKSDVDALRDELAEAKAERDAAAADLNTLRDEARAAMARLQDALAE